MGLFTEKRYGREMKEKEKRMEILANEYGNMDC